MWYLIDFLNSNQDGEIAARVRVPGTSPWFSGHFPGFPVLPGIAQLAMVQDAIGRATKTPVRVTGMRRVRFKQMVQPDQPLDIAVSPAKGIGAFAFRITAGPDLVCTGTLETSPAFKTLSEGTTGDKPHER